MCGAIASGKITASGSTATSQSILDPKELRFELSQESKSHIAKAEKNFDKLVDDQELEVPI
jgi:hypothetical protein